MRQMILMLVGLLVEISANAAPSSGPFLLAADLRQRLDKAPAGESAALQQYVAARERRWESFLRSEREAYSAAVVAPLGINVPVGRWALLRKKNELCALRFTAFHHEIDQEKPPHEVYWVSRYSDYDWAYRSDDESDFSKSNVRTGSGHAASRPNLWRIPRGTYVVKCGPLEAGWEYPNFISLVNKRRVSDEPYVSNGIEIAVTAWKDLKDINVNDPRLVWRRFDADQQQSAGRSMVIPVEELPGDAANPSTSPPPAPAR